MSINRRQFLQTVAAVGAGCGFSSSGLSQVCPVKSGTVRDRLWVFCNPVNADYEYVRKRSVMSPLESALYLGVPNIIMVNQYPTAGQEEWYKPWTPPFEQYAFPLKLLKRVVWSIVGAGGVTSDRERTQILDMARHTPNFVGVFMDDFFQGNGSGVSLTLKQLQSLKQQLRGPGKKLDLYVTLYTQQLDLPIVDYLKLIDVVTLWTGETAELKNLDANLAKLEKLAPKSRKFLGCYTAAYEKKRTPMWTPLPVSAMRQQCEKGLQWLHEGRIEGLIIYGNFMDLNWDAVEWAREWIRKVGETRV